MALRTNSKKAKQNIRNYVDRWASDYLIDDYGYNPEEVNRNIYGIMWEVFCDEMVTHDNRFFCGRVSLAELFEDWASGLARGGLFCYYYNRNAVDDLGEILEETEEERNKYSEEEAEKMLTKLIYRETFNASRL